MGRPNICCSRAAAWAERLAARGGEKQRGGITGKGSVESDPRINRTKRGPGRPPLMWKHQISRYEETAIAVIGAVIEDGRRRLRKRGKDGIRPVHLAATQDVLDRLHGKPAQPVEHVR